MLTELIKLAGRLDQLGLKKQADKVDFLIGKIAAPAIILGEDPYEEINYSETPPEVEEKELKRAIFRLINRDLLEISGLEHLNEESSAKEIASALKEVCNSGGEDTPYIFFIRGDITWTLDKHSQMYYFKVPVLTIYCKQGSGVKSGKEVWDVWFVNGARDTITLKDGTELGIYGEI